MVERRFVLLGLDGLEPALFAPLLRAGLMPQLADLLRRGRHGPLTPILADCAPACWGSLVTGVWPDAHGVLAAREADVPNGGAKAADSASLRAPALWEWLAAAGIDSVRVGLPLTHPATGGGCCVSDAYPGEFLQGGTWGEVPPGAWAGLDAEALGLPDDLRVHPRDLDGDALGPLMPALAEIDQNVDRRPAFVGVALARTFSLHNAATWLLEQRTEAAALIRYPLLDELCRSFLAYHPPRLPTLDETDFGRYQGVIAGAYRLADMLLGRLLALAGEQAAVLLVSTHGFRLAPEFRAGGVGLPDAAPPDIRPEGWWLLAGPGLEAEPEPRAATVLDLAPTVLAALALAPPAAWPGRSLWPTAEPGRACPQPLAEAAPLAAPSADDKDAALLAQLAELGLADPLAQPLAAEQSAALAEQEWNRYRILMQRGETDAACGTLAALCRGGPLALRAGLELGGILGALGRWAEAARLLAPLLPVIETADAAALRKAGLPTRWLTPENYRHGVGAILARAQGDLAAVRRHLDAMGSLPFGIPSLQRLREELEP
jgi:hypothetical protein